MTHNLLGGGDALISWHQLLVQSAKEQKTTLIQFLGPWRKTCDKNYKISGSFKNSNQGVQVL